MHIFVATHDRTEKATGRPMCSKSSLVSSVFDTPMSTMTLNAIAAAPCSRYHNDVRDTASNSVGSSFIARADYNLPI